MKTFYLIINLILIIFCGLLLLNIMQEIDTSTIIENSSHQSPNQSAEKKHQQRTLISPKELSYLFEKNLFRKERSEYKGLPTVTKTKKTKLGMPILLGISNMEDRKEALLKILVKIAGKPAKHQTRWYTEGSELAPGLKLEEIHERFIIINNDSGKIILKTKSLKSSRKLK